MDDKFLLFSLDDEKSKKLGEIISNTTCKKIINLLAEKSLSEGVIAKELKVPVNTIEYNLKKLLSAGIIESSKNYFWSVKGKKIPIYKIANKLIVISPKKSLSSKLKGIIPVIFISGVITAIIGWYYKTQNTVDRIAENALNFGAGLKMESSVFSVPASSSADLVKDAINLCNNQITWEWFLIGCIITLIIFLIFNWKKLYAYVTILQLILLIFLRGVSKNSFVYFIKSYFIQA